MINVKEQIINTVNTLPDSTTWDEALYILYLHSKIKKSEEDIRNGKVMNLQELKKYIDRLEEEYADNNS